MPADLVLLGFGVVELGGVAAGAGLGAALFTRWTV